MVAGTHIEPDEEAELGTKVGVEARFASDSPFGFGDQHIVLEPVELR